MEINLPPEFLKTVFKDEIEIGTIIHRKEDFIPPRDKFSVIIGFCSKGISVARVFINKKINLNVHRTKYLLELQVDILKNNYKFLEFETSFIDCSKINEITIAELENEYSSNPKGFFIGKLKDSDKKKVLDNIIRTKTIKPIQKKTYGWK